MVFPEYRLSYYKLLVKNFCSGRLFKKKDYIIYLDKSLQIRMYCTIIQYMDLKTNAQVPYSDKTYMGD